MLGPFQGKVSASLSQVPPLHWGGGDTTSGDYAPLGRGGACFQFREADRQDALLAAAGTDVNGLKKPSQNLLLVTSGRQENGLLELIPPGALPRASCSSPQVLHRAGREIWLQQQCPGFRDLTPVQPACAAHRMPKRHLSALQTRAGDLAWP